MRADCLLDTNILLYAISDAPSEAAKRDTARQLLAQDDWGLPSFGGILASKIAVFQRIPDNLARIRFGFWRLSSTATTVAKSSFTW